MLVLGIESSCDETAASVVEDGKKVVSNIIASQHDVHAPFGGVVPELASRRHVENLPVVVKEALKAASVELEDIELFAATRGPGLLGALLVGLSAAKAMAWARQKPFAAVNHLHGHMLAAGLTRELVYPHLCLLVSGGHTGLYRVESPTGVREISCTLDDAAGEAFDKVAKMLGLGFPGGPEIEKAAKDGNENAIKFPIANIKGKPDHFSFSGLKTAVRNVLNGGHSTADIAASFQRTVSDTLVKRTMAVAEKQGLKEIVIAGGVACNTHLRNSMKEATEKYGCTAVWPEPVYCTDNAAMIASAGYYLYKENPDGECFKDFLSTDAVANLPVENLAL